MKTLLLCTVTPEGKITFFRRLKNRIYKFKYLMDYGTR